MPDTKSVILRVPATLPADGVHCGDCDLRWSSQQALITGCYTFYCSAWGESPLEEDEGGLLRCEQCRAAEERVKTKAQIEALLDAGGHLQQIVDDEIADCSGCDGTGTVDWTDGDYCGQCPDCAEAREAYRAWDKAVAALAAEEREPTTEAIPEHAPMVRSCEGCGAVTPEADLWEPHATDRLVMPHLKRGFFYCSKCLGLKRSAAPPAESPAPVCDACGPEGCRCEEDRR